MKQIEDMKEQIYEHENKYTELELQNEDLKNNSSTNEDALKKQIERHKAAEAEATKKHDTLKKKYDRDIDDAQNKHENAALQHE